MKFAVLGAGKGGQAISFCHSIMMRIFRKIKRILISLFRRTIDPNIDIRVVYLQRFIYGFNLSDSDVSHLYGLSVKIIDYNSDLDLQQWCDVINNSYDDCYYDIEKARKFLKNHHIFQDGRTAIFYEGAVPCATVRGGGYKLNPIVGGDYRIGVHNNYKGNGLGRMCVVYAFSRLEEQGFRLGESIITIKRVPSLLLHFSLGFEPRYNMRYVTCNTFFKYTSIVQRLRLTVLLYKYNKQYKKKLKQSYLVH